MYYSFLMTTLIFGIDLTRILRLRQQKFGGYQREQEQNKGIKGKIANLPFSLTNLFPPKGRQASQRSPGVTRLDRHKTIQCSRCHLRSLHRTSHHLPFLALTLVLSHDDTRFRAVARREEMISHRLFRRSNGLYQSLP